MKTVFQLKLILKFLELFGEGPKSVDEYFTGKSREILR